MQGCWPACGARSSSVRPAERRPDAEEDLYGGFVGNEDRRTLQRLRTLSPVQLADKRPAFADPRLDELLLRYRARNFPHSLSAVEQAQWQQWRAERLCEGAGGALDLRRFGERLDELAATADERGAAVLAALRDYAASIAPEDAAV